MLVQMAECQMEGLLKIQNFGICFENNQLQIPEPEELPNFNKKMPFVFVCDEAF